MQKTDLKINYNSNTFWGLGTEQYIRIFFANLEELQKAQWGASLKDDFSAE